ncbi:MAG: ArsC family transcriptional regulator, partial [Spirochaetales bacterium]
MTLQLIGTKNNQETRKAERFLKERGLAYQFVDLGQRALSRGELESVARHAGLSNIMDTESREYTSRG